MSDDYDPNEDPTRSATEDLELDAEALDEVTGSEDDEDE